MIRHNTALQAWAQCVPYRSSTYFVCATGNQRPGDLPHDDTDYELAQRHLPDVNAPGAASAANLRAAANSRVAT